MKNVIPIACRAGLHTWGDWVTRGVQHTTKRGEHACQGSVRWCRACGRQSEIAYPRHCDERVGVHA